jgi:hypothetical protein
MDIVSKKLAEGGKEKWKKKKWLGIK